MINKHYNIENAAVITFNKGLQEINLCSVSIEKPCTHQLSLFNQN
jgi:hypothetical protein